MKTMLITLLPVLVVVLLTQIFSRPARAEELVSEREDVVRLRMPRTKVYFGQFFTFLPIPFGPYLFATRPLVDALAILALLSAGSVGGGLFLWAVAARQFLLSRERIEMRGFRGMSFEWADIKEVATAEQGSLQIVQFVAKDGRGIVLDSGMEGWQGLLRALREFGTEHTKPMFERALREIDRGGG